VVTVIEGFGINREVGMDLKIETWVATMTEMKELFATVGPEHFILFDKSGHFQSSIIVRIHQKYSIYSHIKIDQA
jgi:hypothetical protein